MPADSTSLQILVTVRTGGDTATERLYEGRATGLLPMALSSRSGEAALQEGEARITAAVRLREKAAAASEQTFRLYRNGQLEETIPAASRPGIRHLGGHRDGILRRPGTSWRCGSSAWTAWAWDMSSLSGPGR